MKYKINHIALTVNDIEESVKWYEDKLGFKVVDRYENPEIKIAELELGNFKIEFIYFRQHLNPLPDNRKELMSDLHEVGIKHFCLETSDLEIAINALKNKGVEFVTEIDPAGLGGRYVFFKDCNDILVELYEA